MMLQFLSKPSEKQTPPPRNYFLRELGIELLSLLRFGRAPNEVPKPVLHASLWLALSTCCVHFLPVATSITIISFNLSHLYVGFMTGEILDIAINTALLQLAAKTQELLVVASLGMIVIHYIRKQMMFGEGVPLGIAGGGFLFSLLNYFWSPEFWGSLRSQSTTWAKFRLYSLLVFSGLLAATVGPSSAILMIPRTSFWNAGGARVFIQGATEDLWPSRLSQAKLESFCVLPNATSYDVCPSGGLSPMRNIGKTQFYLRNLGGSEMNISTDLIFYGKNITLPGSIESIPNSQLSGNWRATSLETSVHGVNLASAILQYQVVRDLEQVVKAKPYNALKPSISEYKYHYSCSASSSSRIPVVRVACSDAQNISASSRGVSFPTFSEFQCWNSSSKSFAVNSTIPPDGLRGTWLQLPPSFGSVSTGFLFEASENALATSRLSIGCSIDARWVNGITGTDVSANSYATVTDRTYSPDARCQYSTFRPINSDFWTRISMDTDWLQGLAPSAPMEFQKDPTRNTSTLESILMDMGFAADLDQRQLTQTEVWNTMIPGGFNRTVSLEWTLANLIADGLSRVGSARVLNTTGPIASWVPLHYDKSNDYSEQILAGGNPLIKPPDPVVEQEVSVVINGFALLASSITDYLAISALLLHALMALIHTIELVWTRQSSSCWDTVTELLALAQKSRPAPHVLKNKAQGSRSCRHSPRLPRFERPRMLIKARQKIRMLSSCSLTRKEHPSSSTSVASFCLHRSHQQNLCLPKVLMFRNVLRHGPTQEL